MSEQEGETDAFIYDGPSVSHVGRHLVRIEVDGEGFVMQKHHAKEFYRMLATALGCLDGEDSGLYTRHNREVLDT